MSQDHLGIYYRLLKVAPGASATEIKLAYRKLAFEFHPDRNTDIDAEEKFKDITEAYEILTGTRKAPPNASRNGKNGTSATDAAGKQQSGPYGPQAAGTKNANTQRTRQGFAGTGRKAESEEDRFARANEAYRQQQERNATRKSTIHPGVKRHAKHRPTPDQAGFVRCAVTEVVSAQPRLVEFTIVRGFLNSLRIEKITANLAPKGAKRMALKASFKTWLHGFWGWRSFIPAWRAIIGNMRGGILPPEGNAKLLFTQATAFERSGNKPLARAVLSQANDFIGSNRSVLAEQIRANLRRLDDGKPLRRVRSEWKQAGMLDALLHLSPVFVVIFGLLVAFGPGQGFVSHDIPKIVAERTSELTRKVEQFIGEDRDPYYIDRDLLNMREGPGIEYPVIRRLARFETVYIAGSSDDFWIEIETALDETGFVNLDALVPGSGAKARDEWCATNSCD
ncbi:DnaJ domain-containing protein [Thalassospira australica]|uniref:DnaJ domain-containing protein n=1 Tax=Thalassospira australica TaxID=1528106 RepID=UPI00384C8F43